MSAALHEGHSGAWRQRQELRDLPLGSSVYLAQVGALSAPASPLARPVAVLGLCHGLRDARWPPAPTGKVDGEVGRSSDKRWLSCPDKEQGECSLSIIVWCQVTSHNLFLLFSSKHLCQQLAQKTKVRNWILSLFLEKAGDERTRALTSATSRQGAQGQVAALVL